MRCLMKASMPVDSGNQAATSGTLGKTIQKILADLKPEAAYFGEDNGKRTAFLIVDLKDLSEIPKVAEPWFLAFNAAVEFHPVMTMEDLAKAGPHIEDAVRKYATLAAGR
jgi:hypothetical protein